MLWPAAMVFLLLLLYIICYHRYHDGNAACEQSRWTDEGSSKRQLVYQGPEGLVTLITRNKKINL